MSFTLKDSPISSCMREPTPNIPSATAVLPPKDSAFSSMTTLAPSSAAWIDAARPADPLPSTTISQLTVSSASASFAISSARAVSRVAAVPTRVAAASPPLTVIKVRRFKASIKAPSFTMDLDGLYARGRCLPALLTMPTIGSTDCEGKRCFGIARPKRNSRLCKPLKFPTNPGVRA